MSMRVLSQRNDEIRSNAYLVVDTETGRAGFIDCGDPVDHLLAVRPLLTADQRGRLFERLSMGDLR